MSILFVNHSEETAIYPRTIREVAEAQTKDKTLDKLTLLENTNLSLLKRFRFFAKMTSLSSHENYNSMQQNGITTTCNIQEQHV